MDKATSRELTEMISGAIAMDLQEHVVATPTPAPNPIPTPDATPNDGVFDVNGERLRAKGLQGRPSSLLREKKSRSNWHKTFLVQAKIFDFASELIYEKEIRLEQRISMTRAPIELGL